MLGYLKFAILAFILLNASATIKANMELTMNKNMAREELMEAEIKALIELKKIEEAMMMLSSSSSLKKCKPRGEHCNPNLIAPFPECCSKTCGVLPGYKGFVCG